MARLADVLAAEAPAPKVTAKTGGQADPEGLFAKANGVDTVVLLDRLGIAHEDSPRGEMARCPGCSEDGALVCENGGIKCLHDRCAQSGKSGFRTNVDIVAHVQNVDASVAAKTICAWFGIEVKEFKSKPIPEPPAGRFDDEAPMREPGDDTDEAAVKAKVEPEELRVLTVRDIVAASMARAFERTKREACTTAHYRIDDITGGIKPGFVWVFGADTGYGKSSWCVMVADENIKRGKRVLIVSAEDDQRIYGDRLLLRRSRVSADDMRKRRLSREDYAAITRVAQAAEDVPVFFDARGKSVEWITKRTKQLVQQHAIDLIAFDYLQAFDNEKPQQDRRNQVTYIARALTDAAKTSGVAAVIFSQITLQEGKPVPNKHSIRESRDVSNAAEVVALGFIPKTDVVDADKRVLATKNKRTLLLDKVKDGPSGAMLEMPWDERSACFDTVRDPELVRYEQHAEHEQERYPDN